MSEQPRKYQRQPHEIIRSYGGPAALVDGTVRKIVADELEENGHERRAQWLRGLSDDAYIGHATLRTALERRIGSLGIPEHVAPGVYTDEDAEEPLPFGWVRVSDENATVYGPGREILAAIRDVRPGVGAWEHFWESMHGFHNRVNPVDHEATATPYTTQSGRHTVYAHPTNAGLRYHFAPSDREWLADNHPTEYSYDYDTPEEALDEAHRYEGETGAAPG